MQERNVVAVGKIFVSGQKTRSKELGPPNLGHRACTFLMSHVQSPTLKTIIHAAMAFTHTYLGTYIHLSFGAFQSGFRRVIRHQYDLESRNKTMHGGS